MRFSVLAILFMLMSVPAQTQESGAFIAVQKMIAAMSAHDYDTMYESVTEGYQILEHGQVLTMTDMVTSVKHFEIGFARRNYYSVISEVTSTDNVWVSYWKRVDTEMWDESYSTIYLESAVMVKVDGDWKIQMMHVTALDDITNVPHEAQFKEYVE